MNIHICSSVGVGRLRSAIENEIAIAGHTLVARLEFASYVIGYQESDFGPVEPACQIIIKDRFRDDNIVRFQGQHFLHSGMLKMMRSGKNLSQWLKEASDLLDAAM